MGAYHGLAVPLAGKFTTTTAAGTSLSHTDDYGYTTVTLAQTSAYMTAMSPGGVEGIRYRLNVTSTTTGSSTAAFWLDHDSGTNSAGQLFAAEFWITGDDDADVASGQIACIHLVGYLDSGYGGLTTANNAYIKFSDHGLDIANLFMLNAFVEDATGGCWFAATNTTIDSALRIVINSTNYYIGLYDALCT